LTVALIQRLQRKFHSSLHFKLLALALLPLMIVVPVFIFILTTWGVLYFDSLLIGKVRSDMAVAQGYFQQVKDGLGHNIESLALSERLVQTLRERPSDIPDLLQEVAALQKIDYLVLLDASGHTMASSAPGGVTTSIADNETIRRARMGTASSEIDVLDAKVLTAIDPALANKARTPLIPTRNAMPSGQSEESRGMVVQAAASVGTVGAVLVGGMLLNGNLDVVDRINEVVYPAGALPLGSVGTVTLFLDDVRIATNVRIFEGTRAIGTRVSSAVRTAVLSKGQSWRDRAFVVNDWYVSAYEPLLDHSGQRIGMLYVGFLEQPFVHARWFALAAVILLFLLVAAVAGTVSLRLARHIANPVKQMRAVMNDIALGSHTSRVGTLQGADELTELGVHFDHLLNQLADQASALHRWGAELDGKVAERTGELEAANESLRSAQRRLRISEKLAAIGQLAAGVAHEVNNPVAVIQGNLDVLRETLGPSAAPVLPEIRLIQDQVFRIRLIVTKLLQFSRPAEYAGYLEPVQLDGVVQDSLVLIAHQLKKSNVSVVQNLRSCQTTLRNRNELQQVLINLMVNAMQAMESLEQGVMTLSTGEASRNDIRGVFVSVADNGPGIPVANRERLFDPFFTTKPVDGTGLGLWVSAGLVQGYGGRIELECPAEGGAIFTVWLPLNWAAVL
jgi:signal transduction histidine kinase